MWRLIVVTFGILALVFYQLSGGADYAPAEQSVQRQGIGPHLSTRQADRPLRTALPQSAPRAPAPDGTQRVRATLAVVPVTRAGTVDNSEIAQPEKIEALTAEPDDAGLPEDADEAAVIAALQEAGAEMRENSTSAIALIARAEREAETRRLLESEPAPQASAPRDIRVVEGDVVNMRDGPGTEYEKVAALTGGTEVVVLYAPGNGWLELEVLETGQVGWMADWLVSTAFETTDVSVRGANSANAN